MSTQTGPDPTIHRRRLRIALRKAREAAGKTQAQARDAMEWSLSKLIRIESGAVNITRNDLVALLTFYTVPQEQVDELVELARLAREATPWSPYRNVVSSEYLAFLGYESSASVIRNFEPLLIPGLAQTEDYARVVIDAFEPGKSPEEIDALVDLRTQRQDILGRYPSPQVHLMLDEAVIHRWVGSVDLMRGQLRHLLQLIERPDIVVRVVPFSHGIYDGIRGPFVLFEFPEPEDEDVLYLESQAGELIIREGSPEEKGVATAVNYLQAFWNLEQVATQESSRQLISEAVRALTG